MLMGDLMGSWGFLSGGVGPSFIRDLLFFFFLFPSESGESVDWWSY